MAKRGAWLVCLGVAVGVSACGPGTPSESDGKAGLVARVDSGQTARLQVVAFEKTDGKRGSGDFEPDYAMDFTARVRVVASAMVAGATSMPGSPSQLRSTAIAPQDTSKNVWMELQRISLTPDWAMFEGEALQLTGRIHFSLMESGWRATSIYFESRRDTTGRTAAKPSRAP